MTPRRDRLDTLLVFGLTLVAYLLLRQRTFHGPDGWADLRRVLAGDVRSDMHLLYKPEVGLAWRLGDAFGWSLYDVATTLSAFGTALGVAFGHRAACAFGFERGGAFRVALLFAACPGVVFYATVVERHGPFLAWGGLLLWAAATFARRPSSTRAVTFGLAIVGAYAGHSTGVLAAPVLALLAACRARFGFRDEPRTFESFRPLLVPLTVATAVAAIGVVGARQLGVAIGTTPSGSGNVDFFLTLFERSLDDPLAVFGVLWREWLLPFAPISVLWLLAFRTAWLRPHAAAVAIGLLVYLIATYGILASFGFEENGAYLLPMAWPTAVLVVAALPTRIVTAVVVATAILGIGLVIRADTRPLDVERVGYGQAVGADERPYLILGDVEDFEFLHLYLPDYRPNADFFDCLDAGAAPGAATRAQLPALDAWFGAQRAAGRRLLITARAAAYLENPRMTETREGGPVVLAHLRERYAWQPLDAGAWHAWELVPR